jgi:hypothetical protein
MLKVSVAWHGQVSFETLHIISSNAHSGVDSFFLELPVDSFACIQLLSCYLHELVALLEQCHHCEVVASCRVGGVVICQKGFACLHTLFKPPVVHS